MSYDAARDVLHGNLLSAFLIMKHLMPPAPASGASMVCVRSRLGMVGMPNQTLYSAATGGFIALARGAAMEWAPRNIRVNVVVPGLPGVVPRHRRRASRGRGYTVFCTHLPQACREDVREGDGRPWTPSTKRSSPS